MEKKFPNPPYSFAVMRNAHEAIRKAIFEMKNDIEESNKGQFRTHWLEFSRALNVHMKMEDYDMFSLLNGVSDNQITKENIPEEHLEDTKMHKQIDSIVQTEDFDLNELKKVFLAWAEFHDKHLKHEEKIMMPLTKTVGANTAERGEIAFKYLLNPAYNRSPDEFSFFVGWCVSKLNKYGSTANPASVAVRVFAHCIQSISTPAQWNHLKQQVKKNCSEAIWNEMVTDYDIDEPGYQKEIILTKNAEIHFHDLNPASNYQFPSYVPQPPALPPLRTIHIDKPEVTFKLFMKRFFCQIF